MGLQEMLARSGYHDFVRPESFVGSVKTHSVEIGRLPQSVLIETSQVWQHTYINNVQPTQEP